MSPRNANPKRLLASSIALLAVVGSSGCGGDADSKSPVETWGAVAPSNPAAPASDTGPEIARIIFDDVQAMPNRPLRVEAELANVRGDATVRFTYEWKAGGRRMPAESNSILVPSDLQRGDEVTVDVVAWVEGVPSESRTATVRVGNQAPRIEELGIEIVPGEGLDLGFWVADPVASDADDDDIAFRYEWLVEGRGIVGTEERLRRDGWDRGTEVRLTVWATDGEEEGLPLEAAPFEIGNSPPDIVSRPPGLDPSGRFVYQIEARDRDGDRGLRYSLASGPASMAIDPFSGEVVWQASVADAGEHLVEVQVEDRQGGATRQSFYVNVAVDAPPASAR
ncbi:MAG: hypothetical protein ACPGVZ_16770 [Myxococcota bacterium]